MIAKALKFSGKKGIKINKDFYVELVVNSGTEDEPNLVYIYVNIKCGPDNMLGKDISISMSNESFIKKDNKTIIVIDDVKLA